MRPPDITVADNATAARYEIRLDGTLAGFAEYRDKPGRRIFFHTEIDPAYESQGLGSRLIAAALDDALSHGLLIVPRCTFVQAFLRQHPDHEANRTH